jgi:TPR repeat protein
MSGSDSPFFPDALFPDAKDSRMKRLLLAAAQGDADAQFNLGVMYDNRIDDHSNAVRPTDDNGYDIDSNRAEAMKWLLCAAEQGLPRAQTRLAELYAEGPDAALHIVKACQWFTLAMTSLHGFHFERAQAGYERVCALMTPAQIATASSRAKSWQRKWRQSAAQKAAKILEDAANKTRRRGTHAPVLIGRTS